MMMRPAAPYGATAFVPLACLRAAAGLSVVAVAGCVGGDAGQGRTGGAPASAGTQRVAVDGNAFTAAIGPGAPGLMLTAAGARAVAGQSVHVARDGAALAMDEGALAKKAARAGCAAAGGAFSETAIGSYDRAGGWLFPGACA